MPPDKSRLRGSTTFLGVQAVRGFAAVMVVAFHATQTWSQAAADGRSAGPWANGAAGVDIFFVISGFVMAVSTIGREHKSHPARSFLEKRVIRIVPLYWLLTAVVLLKLLVIRHDPGLQNSTEHLRLSAGYVVSSLLFIPYRNSLGAVQPLLYVGWTLSFEAFFYLLFAAALTLRAGILRCLTPVMLLLVLAGAIVHSERYSIWAPLSVITSPLLLEFLAGVALGHATLRGFRIPPGISVVVAALSAAMLLLGPQASSPYRQVVVCGIPALLLIASVVSLEAHFGRRWPRWTLLLGDASYSLYLVHPLIFTFVVKLLRAVHVLGRPTIRRQDELTVVAVGLLVCIPVAVALYRLVESPMTVALRRRWLGEGKPREQVV